jgi:di/tricarboxylate transporter
VCVSCVLVLYSVVRLLEHANRCTSSPECVELPLTTHQHAARSSVLTYAVRTVLHDVVSRSTILMMYTLAVSSAYTLLASLCLRTNPRAQKLKTSAAHCIEA